MKCYSGLFMHTFAIVVGRKFTVPTMICDTTSWDYAIQERIVQGVNHIAFSLRTCSREVLVSYIISKVTERGIRVNFKDSKTEGSWLLELVKNKEDVPFTWVEVGALDRHHCSFYTHSNKTVSEVLKQETQFACGVCSKDIFL